MRSSTTRCLVVLLVLAGVLAACGPDEPQMRLVFSLDFDRAIREGRIPVDADRKRIATETTHTIWKRLDAFAPGKVRMRVFDETRFELSFPEDLRGAVESIEMIVTSLGQLKLRVEVLPTEMYRHGLPGGRTPPRLQQRSTYPWRGTADEFNAFKEEEVRRFKAARDTSSAYQPSRPDEYFVVPRHGTEGVDAQDFAVLEEPLRAEHRFDGGILEHAMTAMDPYFGRPLVLYEVKSQYRDAFEEWTEQNVGLPLAIVLNDVYRSAPVVNSKLRDDVQISLGTGSPAVLEREAEELTSVLSMGSLQVRPTLVSVE